MGVPLTDEECLLAVEAFRQHGSKTAGAGALGLSRSTMANRLANAQRRGFISGEELSQPNINKSAAILEREARNAAAIRHNLKPEADAIAAGPTVKERRLEQENIALRKQIRDALDREIKAEDFRASVFGLSEPLEPVAFRHSGNPSRSRETVILVLSDLQWGEKISLASMDGLNSYDHEIARKRLERIFNTFVELLTTHWAGEPPERIIIVFGGDMISGEIHQELAKSNTLLSIPALKDCASSLIAGIEYVHEQLAGVPIDIISVPGNHGRNTLKPESKLYAEHSYDTLTADLVEMHFRGSDWLRMWKPVSGDALIWIYGYRFLITHGDRIGSRGGHGFVGTAATVARGFKKLVMDYAGRGIVLDFIICGHFHTALELEEGICNGSLPGPSEYSRDGRYRPKPCSQTFLAVHPKYGVTQRRLIQPGSPEEGSLYEPKAAPKDTKPRFRIPAVGERAA